MKAALIDHGQEVAIREAIEKLEKRSKEIKSVVYANPHQEIIDLRKKVKLEIVQNGYDASKVIVENASQRERELLSQIRKQNRSSSALLLELISVDMQIDDLKKELCALTLPVLLNG